MQRPICLVEDSPPIRKLMEILLTRAGFTVVSFENGRDAIEWLQQHGHPLALLCDLILPDIHGVEVLYALRALPGGEHIPAIAVTGLAQEREQQYYLQSGFDAYIVKPISTTTFAAEVKQVIERKSVVA